MANKKTQERLHPYCEKCLREHYGQWYVRKNKVFCKDPGGKEDLEICSLIKEKLDISKSAEKEFTKDELDFANFLYNPSIWTKVELKWEPRWYQDYMLQCSATRKVSRIGRRAGKCLHEDEKITLCSGERIKVKNLVGKNFKITSYNQDTGNFEDSNATASNNGIREIYQIDLDDGSILKRTGNHPLLTAVGWVDCNKINIGQKVAVPLKVDRFGSKDINDDEIKILAYMIGDGNTTSGNCRFSSQSKYIIDDLDNSLKKYKCRLKKYKSNSIYDYHIISDVSGRNNHSVNKLLKKYNLYGKNSHNKKVPEQILSAKKETARLFLNRLFSTDGWASNKSIGYCSVNRELIDDIFELLLRFGIRSRRRNRKNTLNGKIFYSSELNITNRESIIKFCSEIGIYSKEEKINKVYKRFKKHNYSASRFNNYGIDVWNHFSKKIRTILRNKYGLRPEYGPNKRVLNKVLEDMKIPFVEFSNDYLGWSSVKNIKKIGLDNTISIHVDNNNTFITDVIEHNTEAISIKMLHHAYTHENEIILVVAPYKNQVGLIFDKLDMFLSKSRSLQASIKRNTKNPYRIEFFNGSKVLGFTSGTRTGSKSTGIRGQDAHVILIDEADYLSASDFEVILAIQASRPDVEVWCSSTPTGKREMFWRFCTDVGLGYKEFHFPSSVSPSWTKQIERLERSQYSEHGYLHEFDAEFGEEAEGVFPNRYIDESLVDYDMNKLHRDTSALYTVGVDWNTAGNGTVIVVVEWNQKLNNGKGAFRPVRKKIISQAEFTQVRACEEIISINEEWNPSAIYVDQGYGATQIEMLRKYGLENPKTGLVNRVRGIYFGDRMEIRDPITKQKVKKHMKPFIVNIAARRLEEGYVILPVSEDAKNGLVGQIRDYTVIRTTALGQPVYSDNNDHILVAWMLGIFAATMEFSDIAKQNRAYNIGIAGKFGEKKDRDLIINRKIIEEEKKSKKYIIPRWHKPRAFQDRGLGENIKYLDYRNSLLRKQENKSKRLSNKSRELIRGRSNY